MIGAAVESLERQLDGLPTKPGSRTSTERRKRALLLDILDRGWVEQPEFLALLEKHGYDPRAGGGFFGGPRSSLRRDFEGNIHLTETGEFEAKRARFRDG